MNNTPPNTARLPIASAATISPLDRVNHVTGTAAIATITVPLSGLVIGNFDGYLYLIADAAWTTVTTGNIANAITASAGVPYLCVWEGAKWYIK
jgi:hypothetical protein